MAAYLIGRLPAQFTLIHYTPREYNKKNYDLKSAALVVDKTNIASAEPFEPHGHIGFGVGQHKAGLPFLLSGILYAC
jgi:hypothetical protein